MNKVQTIQNKLLKFFLNLHQRYSANELHASLNILKVSDMYEVNILTLVQKCLSSKCPHIFKNYYIQQQHRYDMRERKLSIPRSRTEIGSLSLKSKGATSWNNLNMHLKEKSHFKNFKQNLTKFYITKYRN